LAFTRADVNGDGPFRDDDQCRMMNLVGPAVRTGDTLRSAADRWLQSSK
jgi:hypothetical protein